MSWFSFQRKSESLPTNLTPEQKKVVEEANALARQEPDAVNGEYERMSEEAITKLAERTKKIGGEITLSEEANGPVRDLLRKKYTEYGGRIESLSGNTDYTQQIVALGALYKMTIAKEIIETGRVDYQAILDKLQSGGTVDMRVFNDAWKTIGVYVEGKVAEKREPEEEKSAA